MNLILQKYFSLGLGLQHSLLAKQCHVTIENLLRQQDNVHDVLYNTIVKTKGDPTVLWNPNI